ncbi:apolipoprotein N-acyltransferase [uncultured Treponema sp.]|uniref:apolipoprotein N-acyltransferase n=1 Tax=uncultured Treponema sp. TaxID=162155 RepID=UPI0025F35DCD|nr:apolipoprotein N-acyltransferase [uncultured Treponema sp.]
MSRFLQIFCTLLSALLIAAAIPNELLKFGSPLIGLFALYPFYIAIRRSKSLPETFILCFLHGAVAHLLSSFWLGNFPGFAIFTLGASDLGTGFFEGFFALAFYFPVLFASKSYRLQELAGNKAFAIPFRIFWFSSIYIIWEYCKSTGFLAYPWGTLSMTAYRWESLTQIADITGVYGVTFLFALFSSIMGEGTLLLSEISNSRQGKIRFSSYKTACFTCLALFAISFAYGIHQLSKEIYPEKLMNTILVQQNRNPNRRDEEENITLAQKITQEKLDEIIKKGEKCDLVVWSEAVLSKRFPIAETYYNFYPSENPLIKFIKNNHTPFIIGGPIIFNDELHEYGNSALLFDKSGKFSGSYTKMHLVPFAEAIPFRQYEPVRRIIKGMIGFSYGWTPGKKPVLFEIPLESKLQPEKAFDIISIMPDKKKKQEEPLKSVIISTPICFDDSAHEVCHALYHSGSEVFVNITNDSWSKTDSAEIQHFVVAHYRSIEYRTTTIRAANAGYTVVIDPKGKVIADLPLFKEGALTYKVPVYKREMTIYARLGDWLPYSLLMLVFAYIAVVVKHKKEEEFAARKIETTLLPHRIEWYELLERVMAVYDRDFAIDWNNWNM